MAERRRLLYQRPRITAPRRQAAPSVGGSVHGRAVGRGHGTGIPAAVLALVAASGPAVTRPNVPGHAPVATVTGLGNALGSGTTSQVNTPLTAGQTILVMYAHAGNDTAVVSDDGGNDYLTTSGTTVVPIVNWRVGWAVAVIATAATFVKVTYSGGHANVFRVFRLGGLVSSGALDQSASATGGSANPNSGATGALSQKDELAFEIAAFSGDPSWTADFAHDLGKSDQATILGIGAAWKQVSTVAAVTAAPTLGSAANWWCQVLTFKLA